jgi:hypothetical protein
VNILEHVVDGHHHSEVQILQNRQTKPLGQIQDLTVHHRLFCLELTMLDMTLGAETHLLCVITKPADMTQCRIVTAHSNQCDMNTSP